MLDTVAPVRRIRARSTRAPPVTAETKDLLIRRRLAIRFKSPDYKEVNRLCRASIRRDCVAHINREIAKAKPHNTWRVLRPLIGQKLKQTSAPNITPDALNNYYISIGPTTAASVTRPNSPLPIRLPRVTSSSFRVQAIDMDTLFATLLGMKSSNSTGLDGVSIHMAQMFFEGIGHALLHIVNSCLTTNVVPNGWKHALVTPIPKGGKKDSTDPANTRPISILPAAMKIVEKVVQQQLVEYLENTHILTSAQHGYRKRYSTETALNVVADKILEAMDCGEISLLVLVDLTKCFDVVPHDMLMRKLALYGIDTEWFNSYLTGHTQQVQITNSEGIVSLSQSKQNNIGVFQGGSLSCVLFMIYANDLSLHLPDSVTIVQYADDTQLLIRGKKREIQTIVSEMEKALDSLFVWFCAHGMKVNADKTQMLVLGTPGMLRNMQPVQLNFCGTTIHDNRTVRNLGVTFDRNLNFQSHIDELVQKCHGILIALNHARNVMPKAVLKPIVQAMVISIVRYCISVYGTCGEVQMHRIQKVLNFCARVVTGRRKYDRISDTFSQLRWFTAAELTNYHRLSALHQALITSSPATLALTFGEPARQRHDHDTRRSAERTLPRFNNDAGRRRLNYSAMQLYNNLTFAPHPTAFRQQLKRHILQTDEAIT